MIKALQKVENLDVHETTLPVGDMVIGDHGVERKAIYDFMGSLYSGKLMRQLKELTANFPHPVLILHGDVHEYLSWVRGDAHRTHMSFLSAQAAIARMGVPMIHARTDEEYVETVKALVRQADPNRPDFERPITIRKANRKPEDVKNDIISAVEGFGRKQSRALLAQFGSVRGVANATLDQLQEVEGVGAEKARKIVEAFS